MDYSYTPDYTLVLCGRYPRNFKNILLLMSFYDIWHKNSISHLLRTSRDYFRPPPPKF